MDITAIAELVGTFGFPVAMCVALFWKINKQDEIHKEELGAVTEALNNNTIALTKIYEKLGGG